jgi:chromosome segregation ATPase
LESQGYSADFINQLEIQHERAMSDVYGKLKSQEESYDRASESLSKQVTALRQRADMTNQVYTKEVFQIKEEFEDKLKEIARDRDSTEHNFKSRLHELKLTLEGERTQTEQLRHELSLVKHSSNEEVSRLQSKLRSLQIEHEQAKQQGVEEIRHGQQLIERERQQLRTDRSAYSEEFRRQHEAQVTELRVRLEAKDTLLVSMEQEVNDLRRQLSTRTETAGRDLQTLQDTLHSTRKVLELQESDLDRLKKDREDSRRESRALSKEAAVVEHELAQLRRENLSLKEHNKKLEMIVYGRSKEIELRART